MAKSKRSTPPRDSWQRFLDVVTDGAGETLPTGPTRPHSEREIAAMAFAKALGERFKAARSEEDLGTAIDCILAASRAEHYVESAGAQACIRELLRKLGTISAYVPHDVDITESPRNKTA